MMETITSGSGTCPAKSDPASASAKNSSRLKIRTPAEINMEFDATSNSASASMSVDSLDRLDSSSSLDLFPPNNTSPSFPTVATGSQLKEPSEKIIESGKSRNPGFGETTSPASLEDKKKKYIGFNISNFSSFPKTKSSTNSMVFNLRSERQVGTSGSFFKSFLVKSSRSEKPQEIGDWNLTGHIPIHLAKPQDGSQRLKPVTLTRKTDKPDKVSKLTLFNLKGNLITTTLATRSYPTPTAKSATNEPGGGTGGIGIKHHGHGETAKQTGLLFRLMNSESTSVSLASSLGDSVQNKPGVEGTTPGDSVHNKPGVERTTPGDSVHNKPGVEGTTPGDSVHNKPGVEGTTRGDSVHNKPGVERTTPGDSVHNKPGMEGTSIWKNSPGSGQIGYSTVPQAIEKNKCNGSTSSVNKTVKKARRRSREVWETAKPVENINAKEKSSSKSSHSVHKLSQVSKSREEDRDSSNKQSPNVKRSRVTNTSQGFGKVAYTVNSQDNEMKSYGDICSRFKKNNEQQSKSNESKKRRGVNISGQSNVGAPKIAIFLTESTLGDFSSGFTKKIDENDNINLDEKCNVKNSHCSYADMSPTTDTEYCEKLLDGVVMAISGYEDPLRGQIVRKAVAMGAQYRTDWSNDCSHLVCGFPGTFKYLQAKGRGNIVLGTWIEDSYKSKKKVDWREYILSQEKTDNKPAEVASSPSGGLRFLAGMEVRFKGRLFRQICGKTGFVRGMDHDMVQVMMPCYSQILLPPAELEHLRPEKGDKAKSIVKGQRENVMEVISVDEVEGTAVVRYDGYKGAIVQRNHLCRILQEKPFS